MSASSGEDWRLQGQEAYLKGATFQWRTYVRYSETWRHDHCEFCGAEFAEPGTTSGALTEGYSTPDNYRWVCAQCFADFKERFCWRVHNHLAS